MYLHNYLYIIAEAGVNHNGEVSAALRLVDVARMAGADCVKFQAYTADDLVIKTADKAEYQKQCGEESQHDMLSRYELTEDDFKEINGYCRQKNIDFLVTPFSPMWVKIFYDMGVKVLKISSGSVTSRDLLMEVGKTGLPVILSTGMSAMWEIEAAISILNHSGCKDLSLLHCVSLYPTPIEQVNLFNIRALKKRFGVPVGFSDHTTDILTGQLAVAAGATILEKHFTIDKNQKGPDHKISLMPYELKEYIKKVRRTETICGTEIRKISEEELKIKEIVQSSLVAKGFIKKGQMILKNMLTEKRPSTGISPMDISSVIGRIATKDIEIDEVIKYEYLSE